MEVKRIFIKNYMAIGENPLEIVFDNSRNKFVLVGENNVGKSCILRALERSLSFQDRAFAEEEWHKTETERTIEVILEIILSEEEIKNILEFLEIDTHRLNEVKRDFGITLKYTFKKEVGKSKVYAKWGSLYIWGDIATIAEEEYPLSAFSQPLALKSIPQSESIKSAIQKCYQHKPEVSEILLHKGIKLDKDLLAHIISMLRENILLFPEFRERPETKLFDVSASFSGRELASLLFKLKNGNREEREKFSKIQRYFSELFPGLKVNIIASASKGEVKISIERNGIESTTGFFGAGIFEILLFITHIIASKNKLLCIDEPELHLHPHAQKLLASFIRESTQNQFLLLTHSPFFIDPSEPENVIRVVMKNNQTCLISLPQNYWTPEELDKLRQLLDVDSLELFFAKKVLLVEGPTEVGAFPIFSKDTYDFLTHGVSVIGAGGKNNFKLFIKLLKGFEIPFIGVLDKDPKHEEFEQEVKTLAGDPKRVITLSGKFEEIIEKTEPGLLKEAEEEVGKSKPRAGRYVAQKLIDKGMIPSEFLEVIHRVEEI